MKALELFAGAGGMALGLQKAGFKHVKLVEFNKNACNTLRANFDPSLIYEGDIRDFDFRQLSHIDLVAGGPPCQPFSLAGKHKANTDDRDMFPYAIKAIKELRPKGFIFENVKGLLRASFSEYFELVILRLTYPSLFNEDNKWNDELKKLRAIHSNPKIYPEYSITYKLLNAADYGVPQTRERVFIVGTRADLNCKFQFPEPTHSKASLKHDQTNSLAYWVRHGIDQEPESLKEAKGKYVQASLFSKPLMPWVTVRDTLKHHPDPRFSEGPEDNIFRDGAKIYPGHTGSYIDLPAKTLKAGVHGVPGGENMIRYRDGSVRYFTVYEGKLLQTFPENYKIIGAWSEGMRQIGNAVPVDLAFVIGVSLKKTLVRAVSLHSIHDKAKQPNSIS